MGRRGQRDTDEGIPTAADRVIIPANETVFIELNDDFTADSLEIEAFGTLWITGSARLTLENDNIHCGGSPSPACGLRDNHLINGTINIDDDGILRFVEEEIHVLGGNGQIQGISLAPDPRITIDVDVTLVNQLGGGMWGGLTIFGMPFTTYPHTRDGGFENQSFVKSIGVIVLASSTNLSDVEGAQWLIAGFCAGLYAGTMEFHREALLDGDFEAETAHACFQFFESVETFGTYINTACDGVWVDDENDATFCYWQYDASDCLEGNPGMGEDPYCIDYVYCSECP